MNQEVDSMTCKHHGFIEGEAVCREKSKNIARGYLLRCVQCRRDKDRRYKLNNPDKHKESACRKRNEDRRLYREGLTDIEPKANVWARNDRKNNPEKHKEWSRKSREKQGQFRNTKEVCRKIGLDINVYYDMLKKQNNLCAICKNPETRKSRSAGKICQLAIDHCHTTGKIRSLLCHYCNVGLGSFKDNIEFLKSAIAYLENHNTH